MKKIALAAILATLAAPAAAEEIPIWTGAYIGVHGGYATGTQVGDTYWYDHNTETDLDVGDGKIEAEGGLVGLELGYNHQIGVLVLGVEADFGVGSVEGQTSVSMGTGYRWDIDTQVGMLATLRARAGIAFGPVLLYGTGGIAYGDTTSNEESVITDTQQGLPVDMTTVEARSNDDRFGFVYGAGAEWMIAKGLSLKGEWLHVDLGDAETRFNGTAYPGADNEFTGYTDDSFPSSLEMDLFRAGLNYRF